MTAACVRYRVGFPEADKARELEDLYRRVLSIQACSTGLVRPCGYTRCGIMGYCKVNLLWVPFAHRVGRSRVRGDSSGTAG
jgi:hypothetical protein